MISIELSNRVVLDALSRLDRAASDIRPALAEIAEVLTESTKQRFANSVAPDGSSWDDNAPSTLENKTGETPLIGETRSLASTINAQLNADTLEIGSPMEYAAMQQFGGTKEEFPNLWGDIPARPFLGISEQDEIEILEIVSEYLEDALR